MAPGRGLMKTVKLLCPSASWLMSPGLHLLHETRRPICTLQVSPGHKHMSCFWLQQVQTRRSHLKCVEGGGQVHCKHLHRSSQPLRDPRADQPGLPLRALEVRQGPEQRW